MRLAQFEFVAAIDMSVPTCTVIHVRHLVESICYDSSVYLPVPLLDCIPEQALPQAVDMATGQVNYVVQSTREMRIL